MAQAVDLNRTAAESCQQEALSRSKSFSALGLEVRFTFWLTFRQANELGGHVRKGEESTVVVFWKVDDAKQGTGERDNEETDGKTRRRFLLRYYRVFNLEQCELPQTVLDKLPKTEAHEYDPIETAERIIAEMPNRPEIQYAGSKAFYSPLTDRITLPPRELFTSAEEFYATVLHEAVHSSGSEKRLAREGICEAAPFGSPVYSKEELWRKLEPLTFAQKPEFQTQSSTIKPLCGRLAQEASRRSQAPDPRSRAGAARRGLYPPGPARSLKIGGARAMRGRRYPVNRSPSAGTRLSDSRPLVWLLLKARPNGSSPRIAPSPKDSN